MASVFTSPVSVSVSVWAPTNPRLQRTPSTSMFVSLASSDSQPPSEDLDPETTATGDRSRKDRRRVVRLAWEKLVRWSRSWRSKAKIDVLERTNKVSFFLSFFILQLRVHFIFWCSINFFSYIGPFCLLNRNDPWLSMTVIQYLNF